MACDPDYEVAFPPGKSYQPLPARGLLAAAGFDLKTARRAAPSAGEDRSPLWAGLTRLTVWPEAFLAGPVLGAPMAVMALEELIRRGAREIIFLGLAGSLTADLEPGALVSPEEGLSTEGTSAHYPAPLRPDADLRGRVLDRAAPGEIGGGSIWSTDGLFRETFGLVADQKAAGARMVDMETTALWAAAAFRRVRLTALLVISDRLDDERHHVGMRRPEFKSGLARAAELAWSVLTDRDC